eukprot:TRINITY_DN92154_c0_g1_i1.p1 TRINITY_DN92154_c0_g1~~TRINITY_DN92154_c0_g1_i1.p1  ORF type:complete len:314 (-),score=53.59 TRINITY_DN92154_c0_g1_i1:116-1057(-)
MSEKKEKVKTKASKEAMRWADDEQEGAIEQCPDKQTGNVFDVKMAEEADGVLAAKKIVKILKERGVCVVQANAPFDLCCAAHDEAESLWEDDHFKPPIRVHDDRSMLEAQLWNRALADEDKTVWIVDTEPHMKMKNALKLLGRNIADFCGGIGPLLASELGINFDRLGKPLLTCYTGDKQYTLHIDNPHGDDEDGMPDNGLRLSCTYYINPHWNPTEGEMGGLDVHLSGASSSPSSAASARKFPRLRVAPHADTLVLHLSERMAHRVIATQGQERWFSIQLWGLNGAAMQQMSKKVMARRQQSYKAESDDDID